MCRAQDTPVFGDPWVCIPERRVLLRREYTPPGWGPGVFAGAGYARWGQ